VIQAEWDQWCQAMNDSTWNSPEILRMANSLVFVRVDGDLDTTTVAKYHVSRIPTTILVTDQGAEVDRFVGYFSAAELLEELTRALEGADTMWELERRQTESRGDPKLTLAIAREFIERGEMARAEEYLTRVKAADANGELGVGDDALFVQAQLERDDNNWYKAIENLKKLVKDHPESEWREDAELYIPWLYAQAGDKKEALKKYNEFLDEYGSSSETQWVKRQIAKLETPTEVPVETKPQEEGQ
jgi:tetratricopeptide (TPR) repeat protein